MGCPLGGVDCTWAMLKAGLMMGMMCWVSGSGGHHLPDVLQRAGAEGQEQTPGALTDGYQQSGAHSPNPADPKWHSKGTEDTSVLDWREAASSSQQEWCWNNFCMAEEAGRSTEQVAVVQMGTEEMLRASLRQLAAFLSQEKKKPRNLAANWGRILQTLLFLTNK